MIHHYENSYENHDFPMKSPLFKVPDAIDEDEVRLTRPTPKCAEYGFNSFPRCFFLCGYAWYEWNMG